MFPVIAARPEHLSCCSGTNKTDTQDSYPAGCAKQGEDGGRHFAAIEGIEGWFLQLCYCTPFLGV